MNATRTMFGIQRDHAREILRLAIPTIAGLSSQTVVSLINAAMIGRLKNAGVQLAAMGLGFLGTMAVTSFFSSLGTGTTVLSARRKGENNHHGAGDVLNNSLFLCLIIGGVVGVLGAMFSYNIMDFFSKDDAVTRAGTDYMKYQFLGLPFFLFIVAYRAFFMGIGHAKVFMISAIIVNLLNILCNYIFVFGAFGAPRMELAGAGLGALLSMVAGWLFFVGVTFLRDYRTQYRYYSHFSLSKEVVWQIVRISIPVSFQNILILLGFLVFVAITGIIGVVEQAASNVVINALFITLMPCFGFGVSAQTLVGQAIGRGDDHMAHTYGYETAKLATIFTMAIGILFVVFPDLIISIVTTETDIVEATRPILRIAGMAQILYGAGIIFANCLQAGGATLFVMYVEVITHWLVFLPLTYVFGVTFGWGINGSWLALPVYVVTYAAMNFWKFRSAEWMKVKI